MKYVKSYGANYSRSAAISQFDPGHVFRLNQNIQGWGKIVTDLRRPLALNRSGNRRLNHALYFIVL